MTRGARHEFEGEQLTVAEIRERVPVLSADTIRRHLAAGRRTSGDMLSFDPRAKFAAAGRKARTGRNWNYSTLGAPR